jgi:MFS family permease
VRRYLELLRNRPFAALWTGSTVSAFGDALTWVSLVWLVFEISGSPRAVAVLVVAATAPVIVGGFVMGLALDRYDRRRLLIWVNLILGASVASIPLLHRAGLLAPWHLYAVAAIYGLLKMANWAGVPSLIPSFVDETDLNTANAMESISFGIADVAGPATAGVLIALIGAANVLAIDAITYIAFVIALTTLRRPPTTRIDEPHARVRLRPAFAFLRRTPPILATTLMFMAFNIGEGMLLVLLPTFAREQLQGGPGTFGVLLSAFSLTALLGSFVVGAIEWRRPLGRSIALAQTLAGLSFLGLAAADRLPPAVVTLAIAGLLVSPVTIWAQTIRMRLIPEGLRGRVFGVLRTLMQSTPPLGGAVAGWLLAGPGIGPAVVAMVLVMTIPGLIGLFSPALSERQTTAPERAISS